MSLRNCLEYQCYALPFKRYLKNGDIYTKTHTHMYTNLYHLYVAA